jgi:hypothetical protein
MPPHKTGAAAVSTGTLKRRIMPGALYDQVEAHHDFIVYTRELK